MMIVIGQFVVYAIVISALIGAVCAIVQPKKGLGKEFIEGIYSIGPIFLSVAGIFAYIPYIAEFIQQIFAPIFHLTGADSSMAATTIIAVDMGGYQLAQRIAATKEDWIIAMMTGYMAGATIVFSIPVGLTIIEKKEQSYFALGMLSGILSIPIGVFVSSFIIAVTKPFIRETITTNGTATYQLSIQYIQIFKNLIPLIIICILLAIGLLFFSNSMIKGFLLLGCVLNIGTKLFLAFFIAEHFTGFFSCIFGNWAFDPVFADASNQERALEIAGYTSLMLSGAFPLVYMIKKAVYKILNQFQKQFSFDLDTIVGSVTASANILALYPMLKDMKAKNKVQTIAFAVCGAFLIGDHLSFTANFQPTLIVPLFLGKLTAGCFAVLIANKIAVPKAEKLELEENKKRS